MSDGTTLRDHLEVVQRMTNKPQPELQTGNIPDCVKHVWYWFLRLNAKRTSSGMGSANPITYTEIKSFFELEGIVPESWEMSLLERFDRVAMVFFSKQQEEQNNKKNK